MKQSDFSLTLTTEKTPEEVFEIITYVRSWWSGLHNEAFEGTSTQTGDEFTFRAGEGAHYSKQLLVEVIPNKKVVWKITESNLSFLEQPEEWTGTEVIFEIAETEGKTQLTFTHRGLTPAMECYDSCAPAWTGYLQQKLLPLIQS